LQEISVGGEICGTQYKAKIIESFKAPSSSTKEPNLAFGRASGLRVGNTYLVFAKFVSEPDVIYNALVSDRDDNVQSLISKRSKASVLDLIRCKGLAPGLIFMPDFYAPDGAWRVTERGVYIVGILPQPLPVTIHVEQLGGAAYFLRGEDLFGYLRSLGLSQSPTKPLH